MPDIHPTAIIESGAQLADGVMVGAYAYIGAEVTIGAGTVVHHHATVEGWTTLGEGNEVWPYAMVGGKTHDLKYTGGRPGLKIGDRNVFREYSTVHCGTNDGEFTTMGNDNHVLAYSHIAHDCQVGNHLVMSSHAALGGHVIVGDRVVVGWNAGTHQFCRIGSYAMVGACAKAVQDIPPFMIADGNPAEVRTINKVGLERDGFTAEEISLARAIYKIFYRENLNKTQALEKLREHPQADSRIAQMILDFAATGDRGWA